MEGDVTPARQQAPTNHSWQLGCKDGSSEVCSVRFPSGSQPWLPTVVTHLIMCLLRGCLCSQFLTLLLVLPDIIHTSQMSNLHLNPCLGVCFWGNSNQDTCQSFSSPHPHGAARSDSELSVALRKVFFLREKTPCLVWSEMLLEKVFQVIFQVSYIRLKSRHNVTRLDRNKLHSLGSGDLSERDHLLDAYLWSRNSKAAFCIVPTKPAVLNALLFTMHHKKLVKHTEIFLTYEQACRVSGSQ